MFHIPSRFFRPGVALLAACALPAFVPAQEASPQDPVDLPTLEVTGTRLTNPPLLQPYAFYRTTTEDLNVRIGRTALDRINYGPGIMIQRTAPNQASPFIRGLTGEQALLLLDGVRFSHAFMRPGPNQYAALVPSVSVSAMDAILGSSSVVNGSDGLTGGLDYRLPMAGRGVDEEASPWLGGRIDSGNGGTLMGGVDGRVGAWAYSFEVSGSLFHDRVGGDDFRDRIFVDNPNAFDEIPNTAYDEYATGLRLAYFGLDNHLLELKSGYTRQEDAPRPGGYAQNSGKPDRIYRFFDPQEFTYVHLRDTWFVESDAIERLQTTLWWHRFGEEQFRASIRDFGEPDERIRQREFDDTLDALGLDLQATTRWGGAHELTWGGTFIHETTDNQYREFRTPKGSRDLSLASPFNPGDWQNKTSVSDGADYTTLGLYAQDYWELMPDVQLLTGLRYSLVDWSFGDVDGDTDDVTGGLRAQWQPIRDHNLFAGVSKAFRAPNLQNLDGVVDRGSSGNAASGNPDLESETSWTVEGGWKWQRARDRLAFTVFNTEIDDLIQRDFSAGGEFTNVEGADLYGFESDWDLELAFLTGDHEDNRLSLVGSVSLVDATRDIPVEGGGTVEDNISRANRLFGRVGLKLERGPNYWALAQIRWHDDYDDVATHPSDSDADDIRLTVAGNPDGGVPGYEVVDLHVGWTSDDERVAISIFVENIADETYRVPGSGTDGVGRSFGMTGKVAFNRPSHLPTTAPVPGASLIRPRPADFTVSSQHGFHPRAKRILGHKSPANGLAVPRMKDE